MSDEALDLYCDTAQVAISPFGVVLACGIQPLQPGMSPTKVCNLRMSLEHAKVLAIMLKRQLTNFEGTMGQPIPLHPQLYTQLGLSKTEDW